MTEKRYPDLRGETLEDILDWVKEVTRTREEDIGNADKARNDNEQTATEAAEALAAVVAALPAKGAGTDVDTGTDDAKYLTAKALNDSHNLVNTAPGTAGNYPRSNGTDWESTAFPATGPTLGTSQATTSGTSIDFSGIPSTATRVTVMWSGMSTSGTSAPIIQIGPTGGVETTGYAGSAFVSVGSTVGGASPTNGVQINASGSLLAASVMNGSAVFNKLNGNTWVAMGISGLSNGASITYFASAKTLAGTLEKVRITTSGGTDTFDAGEANYSYE